MHQDALNRINFENFQRVILPDPHPLEALGKAGSEKGIGMKEKVGRERKGRLKLPLRNTRYATANKWHATP